MESALAYSKRWTDVSNPPDQPADYPAGRVAHVLAWTLAVGVFPLVWMGGLVTTFSAGMAVPDWPTTFGHWFYPVQEWMWGVGDVLWDVFLEHGHRTIAQLVGLVTVALAVALWRKDPRKWMRWLVGAALLALVAQATLGGLRVLSDSAAMPNAARVLAKTHGCTAPLFFALAAALVALTSRRWAQAAAQSPPGPRVSLPWAGVAITGVIYAEIFVGAQLRHLPPDGWLGWFAIWVWVKVIVAAVLAVGAAWLLVRIARSDRHCPFLVRRAAVLAALVGLQLIMAAATWVTNYGWPNWFTGMFGRIEYTIEQEGLLQVFLTTAHTAVGSLLLAAAVSLALWSFRLAGSRTAGGAE